MSARGSSVTLEQIDRELVDWQNRLASATQNLIDLDDVPAYRRLRGEPGLPSLALAGVTAAKAPQALAALGRIWQSLQILNEVVNRAVEQRKALPRFWTSDSSLQQIADLLHGASVPLAPEQTPLEQRDLFGAAEKSRFTSPEKLLLEMSQTFLQARDVIVAIDGAWNRLTPALEFADREAAQLEQIATTLGENESPELTTLRARIAQLRTRVETDPLGTDADLGRDIAPLLQRVRGYLQEQANQIAHLRSGLTQARTILEEMTDLEAQALQTWEACRSRVVHPAGLCAPPDAGALAEMRSWLETLEMAVQQGRWKPVPVGLGRWLERAEAFRVSAQTALEAARAPLETLAELRGRLSSLRAKAQSFHARGQNLDPALPSLAEQAEHLLKQTPAEVDRAGGLVAEYERRLNARSGGVSLP